MKKENQKKMIDTYLGILEKELIMLQGDESHDKLKGYSHSLERNQGKIHGYKVAIQFIKEIKERL